jgi:poly-gamma-glutamate synthesis protein (capsule biosynthesis protein)
MAVLGLLGDVMLGREVARVLRRDGPAPLFSAELVSVLREADAVVANLECCISNRGEKWPDPNKPFFFRAPRIAVDALARLNVSAVTMANNHALDYGYDALEDTLGCLRDAGIATTGAGCDVESAHRAAKLTTNGVSIVVVGCTDHPREYAVTDSHPGVAYARLHESRLDPWLEDAIRRADADCVLVAPHWGPNLVASPTHRVRKAAATLVRAGADLVAGHSAHVFHGVAGRVAYDLGDFIDDYAVHAELRNDLGLVFLVEVDRNGPRELTAVPIALDFCHTRLADAEESDWIGRRFTAACAALGTSVRERRGRLVVELPRRATS